MPDDDKSSDDSVETISMSEYKKLQRKYDRRNSSARHSEEQVETLAASVARIESVLLGLTGLVATDEDLKPIATTLVEQNSQRQTADTSSAQLKARLTQIIDDADEDWGDEKFDEASKVLDEINESGDLSRASEVERLIREAVTVKESRTVEEQITAAVEQILQGKHVEASRVDTGKSTARTGNVTRQELSQLDPRGGIAAMRAKTNAALDQLFGT